MSEQTAPATETQQIQPDRARAFVDYIIDRSQQDRGLAARLRRANNPATEYQSWETLARFGINLERTAQRLPYTTIAAAIAHAKPTINGNRHLCQALAQSYDKGSDSEQAKAKLRRLLACSTTDEACRVLRPLLTLVFSKTGNNLDYHRLLRQLLWFEQNTERVRAQWAQEFYRRETSETAVTDGVAA
jgi:CRISPR system Cascade subunit CasB